MTEEGEEEEEYARLRLEEQKGDRDSARHPSVSVRVRLLETSEGGP